MRQRSSGGLGASAASAKSQNPSKWSAPVSPNQSAVTSTPRKRGGRGSSKINASARKKPMINPTRGYALTANFKSSSRQSRTKGTGSVVRKPNATRSARPYCLTWGSQSRQHHGGAGAGLQKDVRVGPVDLTDERFGQDLGGGARRPEPSLVQHQDPVTDARG